jgi:peptide deformylase
MKVMPECEPPYDNYSLFCAELLKTCTSYKSCVGLAAPQVGVELRIFVFCGRVAINPEITAQTGATEEMEGCMSLPGYQVKVRRAQLVMASFYNEKGKHVKCALNGLEARVFQHELDHLNGKLIADAEIINLRKEHERRVAEHQKRVRELHAEGRI